MNKRTEFTRDTVEVCRNCKADGTVEDNTGKINCPVCGGSGLVRKHFEGFVSIKPFIKDKDS